MRHTVVFGCAALALVVSHLAPISSTSSPAPMLHLAARWPVEGDGGWDDLCADTSGRRLFVSHGTCVEVLDLDRGTPLAHIDSTAGVHAIAIARDLRRGFISCGRDSS